MARSVNRGHEVSSLITRKTDTSIPAALTASAVAEFGMDAQPVNMVNLARKNSRENQQPIIEGQAVGQAECTIRPASSPHENLSPSTPFPNLAAPSLLQATDGLLCSKVHIDESGIHDGSLVVVVATDLARSKNWAAFTTEWKRAIRPIKVYRA
jgi:hypothetical protein